MAHKSCGKYTRFSIPRLIRSSLILGVMLFCMVVAVRDAFRPTLASVVHCFRCLEEAVSVIRRCWLYSVLHDAVDRISESMNPSGLIIGIIGLSGTAVQLLSDVSVSKYPGLEKRAVFVWHYPGYAVMYILHICLVLLGEYAVDIGLNRCAIFCQVGLITSFAYSMWIMVMSMLPQNTQRFLKPYIAKQVNVYNKGAREKMPAKGTAMYNGLLYRLPAAAYGMGGQVSLNRLFEDLIRENGTLWNNLLGNYTRQEHAQQAEACSLVLQIVEQQKNGEDHMLPEYFACGLLLWLHSSAPHIFSAEERWEMITQFLADVSMERHRAPGEKEKAAMTGGMTYGIWNGEDVSDEVRISMIALNLLYIENLLWQPMPEAAFVRIEKRLEGIICRNNIRPHFAVEQRYGFMACAMMVYESITYFTYEHMLFPSRETVARIVQYLNGAVQL